MMRLILILAGLAILLGGTLLWLASAPTDDVSDSYAPATAAAPPGRTAPSPAGDGEADGAKNSFAVCPGDPRCP